MNYGRSSEAGEMNQEGGGVTDQREKSSVKNRNNCESDVVNETVQIPHSSVLNLEARFVTFDKFPHLQQIKGESSRHFWPGPFREEIKKKRKRQKKMRATQEWLPHRRQRRPRSEAPTIDNRKRKSRRRRHERRRHTRTTAEAAIPSEAWAMAC